MESVRTRMAPSPTGYFHVGSARTALFNFIYAKKMGGKFILRIEDTDKKRSEDKYEEDILEQMNWLGLTPDETYKQSELVKNHESALGALIKSEKAYISREASKEDKETEVEVIRLKNKGEVVKFSDLIRGEISFDTTELGDFVIARSTTEPLYHLAVVVDDNEMNISHVIRGEDHISNTARQILIQRALGFDVPKYAHLPLILAPDKSKLSKRKHSFAVVRQLREDGFESEALVNFLTLIGWSPKGDREVISPEETISEFEISNVHKSSAVFDVEKLRWMNREYLIRISDSEFESKCIDELENAGIKKFNSVMAKKLAPIIRDRIHIWNDISIMVGEGELDYFFSEPSVDVSKMPWKDTGLEKTIEHLEHVAQILSDANDKEFASAESVKNLLWEYADEQGRGEVLWPLRYALSGRDKSPDPFTLISILGKEATLSRIKKAAL